MPARFSRDSLPPLSLLLAFEATGRLGGIRRAGFALKVDHTVVSRRIRALEDWAGTRLVTRQHTATTLTPEGARFHGKVTQALADLTLAAAELRRSGAENHLSIWCVPGFASQWLISRLYGFKSANENISLELRPTDRSPDFDRFEADVDIRYIPDTAAKLAPHVGVRQLEIARPAVLAVASPLHPAVGTPLRNVAELTNAPLLHEESDAEWRAWFTALGLPTPTALAGPRLWHGHLTLEAARCGQGIALANRFLVREELASGQLVDVMDVMKDPREVTLGAYVLTARRDRWQSSTIARFRRWLTAQARAQ